MKLMVSGVTFSAAPYEIALILAIFVVDDDNHAAFAYFSDGIFNSSESHSAVWSPLMLGFQSRKFSVC